MSNSTNKTLTITQVFKAGDYTISKEEDDYVRIVMDGFGSSVAPGKPQLPGKTFHVELPKDAVIKKIDIISSKTSELEGIYKILPALVIVHDRPDPQRENLIESALSEWESNYRITHQSDDLFPLEPISDLGHWIGRNISYSRIRFHPFQYRPKSGRLILHKSVKVAISFSLRTDDKERMQSKRQGSHIKQESTHDSTNRYGRYNFVIIVPDSAIVQAVAGFKAWKELIGHSVAVVESRHIYNNYSGVDNAERIREFLIDKYEEWGIHYVMLVGDMSVIPTRILYSRPLKPDKYRPYAADFYYADLQTVQWDVDGDQRWGEFYDDKFNWLHDVVVSRLPFNHPDEIEKICNNIISFEMDTGAWKKIELFAHGFMDLCPTDTAELAERIESDFLIPGGWNARKLYEQGGTAPSKYLSDLPLTQADYEAECDHKNQGVVCLTAHGGPDFMQSLTCTEPSGNCNCKTKKYLGRNNFGNGNRIIGNFLSAVVVMNGCSTAPPGDHPIETGGRSLYQINAVQDHNGKRYLETGAVAVIGSSAGSDYASKWKNPVDGGSQSLIYYFHEHLIGHTKSVGDAFFDAAVDQANKHGLARGLRVFYLMGDPSLIVTGIADVSLYQYAVKFVCGISRGDILAPGEYWTAINIHNPTSSTIRFRKKIAVALPNERARPVTEFFDAGLGPDEALEIDREDIFKHAKQGADFLKGFVIIESYVELDVVAVYTATGSNKQIDTMHMERVTPRQQMRAPRAIDKPDLVPVPDEKGNFCKTKDGMLVVTVKNQGTLLAGPSMTKVDFYEHGTITEQTPSLAPGKLVDISFKMPTPDCAFKITVDADDDVIESNEGNNTASGFCIG